MKYLYTITKKRLTVVDVAAVGALARVHSVHAFLNLKSSLDYVCLFFASMSFQEIIAVVRRVFLGQ